MGANVDQNSQRMSSNPIYGNNMQNPSPGYS